MLFVTLQGSIFGVSRCLELFSRKPEVLPDLYHYPNGQLLRSNVCALRHFAFHTFAKVVIIGIRDDFRGTLEAAVIGFHIQNSYYVCRLT